MTRERESWRLDYENGIANVRRLAREVVCFDDYVTALDISLSAIAALLDDFPPGPLLSQEELNRIYAPAAELLNDFTFLRSRGMTVNVQSGLAAEYADDPDFAEARKLSNFARPLDDADRLAMLDKVYSLTACLIVGYMLKALPLPTPLQHYLVHTALVAHILVSPQIVQELPAEHQHLATTPFPYDRVRYPPPPGVEPARQLSLDIARALLERQSEAAAAYARLELRHHWTDAVIAIEALEAIRSFLADATTLPFPTQDVFSFDGTLNMASLLQGFAARGPFKVAHAGYHVAVIPDHDERRRVFVLTFPIECGAFSDIVTLERLDEYRRDPLAFCYLHAAEREHAVLLRSIEASVQSMATLERAAFLDATIARMPAAALSATATVARNAAEAAKYAVPIARDAADALEAFGWTWLGSVVIHYPQPVKTALVSAFAVFAQKLRTRFRGTRGRKQD